MSVCFYCQGARFVHRAACQASISEDDLDCNCDYPRCDKCNGRGRRDGIKDEKELLGLSSTKKRRI